MSTCNVCGTETRCYSLTERDLSRPSPVVGMIFYICSVCLNELISKIAKQSTKLDDPVSTPARRIPGGLPGVPDRIHPGKRNG